MNINISSYSDFIKIDNEFLHYLQINDDKNYQYLLNKRLTKQKMNSENIIKIGIHLDNFLSERFNLQIWQKQNIQNTEFEKEISHYKRVFFQRFILQKYNKNWHETLHENHIKFLQQNINENIDIENIDIEIINYLTLLNYKNNYENINDEKFIIYCESLAIIYYKNLCHNSSLLKGITKIDSANLDKTNINQSNRAGFEWTNIITQKDVLYNANYCLYCHERCKDSCKNGLHKNNQILVNSLGNELHGCPIDEDISEMIKVYSIGYLIASLSIMMIENPLACLTGDRICNDCMKSCIYQNQEPVDIPKIESFILENIIKQKYGFEIYFLLSRWNPLNTIQYLPESIKNTNVYISGMGPAGISCAFYQAKNGNNVYLADGGLFISFNIEENQIIENFPLYEKQQNRSSSCFGGIMEYGITVRWNKNFLLCAYILLCRFQNIHFLSSIKYTTYLENILLAMKFDKIFIANGTKNPNHINNIELSNYIINASDFLMNLQLGKSFIQNSKHNININLPAIVLGGGLTAIDSACEIGFYYLQKIENIYQKLQNNNAEFSKYEIENLQKYIHDYNKIKDLSISNVEKIKLLGGVKILIKNNIIQSPAYKTNHIEILKAKELGIEFIENANIKTIEKCNNGVNIFLQNDDIIYAQSIIIAYGSNHEKFNFLPNNKIVYLGDLTQKYGGNVIKAITSGKIASEVKIENNKKSNNFSEYFTQEVLISNIKNDIYEVKFTSKLLQEIAKVGDLMKLKIYNYDIQSESIPIIIAKKDNEYFYSIIKIAGNSTKMIADKKMKYSIMYSSSSMELQNLFNKKITIYFDESRKAFTEVFDKNFINAEIKSMHNFNNSDTLILFLCNAESMYNILKNHHLNRKNCRWIISIPMQCMLSGVCSRCKYSSNKCIKYGCEDYLVNPCKINIEEIIKSCNRDIF